jgi:4-amino-4-deoxy-L-arabinose transferase-like glycosyltransferase
MTGGASRRRRLQLADFRPTRRLYELGAVLAVLALTVASRYPTLRQPLVEMHAFRQAQTAYPALIFSERGIDLLHPTLPTLGPPFGVPFEFPLFQALASLLMDAGIRADPALRITGLACFLATAACLYLIARRLSGVAGAMVALLVFVASPFGLVWSRTSMIEYLATAASLGWLLCYLVWLDDRRGRWLVLAAGAGVIAALVKITTAAFWGLPVAALLLGVRGITRHAALRLVAALALPALLGIAWLRYGDSVKSANEFAASLSSVSLPEWTFGPIAQRLDPDQQGVLFARGLLAFGGWPLTAAAALAACRILAEPGRRLVWAAVIGVAVLAPLTLFNLYRVHDYYWIAVTPAAALLVGGGIGASWRRRSTVAWRASLTGAFTAVLVLSVAQSSAYWLPAYERVVDPDGVLPAAAALAQASEPTDLALVVGADWSPAILYYARRWGLALPSWAEEADGALRLRETDYTVAEFLNPAGGPLHYLRQWPWVGVTGGLTYVMGDSPGALRGAPLSTYLGEAPLSAPSDATSLLDRQLRLQCEAGLVQLPTGRGGTWIEFAKAPPAARLWIVNAYAPVPVGRWVFLSQSASQPGVGGTVTCNGAASLTILQIVDASPP